MSPLVMNTAMPDVSIGPIYYFAYIVTYFSIWNVVGYCYTVYSIDDLSC